MSKVTIEYGKGVEICVSWQDGCDGSIPEHSVKADGPCYVARAKHNGEFIPGKLVEGYNNVFICYGGEEMTKLHYQVLVDTSVLPGTGYKWQWTEDLEVPKNAIIGGTDNGFPLFIVKSEIKAETVVGKFQPEQGCAYFPYGGIEHAKDEFEILCCVTKHL